MTQGRNISSGSTGFYQATFSKKEGKKMAFGEVAIILGAGYLVIGAWLVFANWRIERRRKREGW